MADMNVPDDNGTLRLPAETLAEIAEAAIAHQRYADAVEIYASLAAAHRGSNHFAARTYYARGMLLMTENARVEARMALDHALALDPALDAARSALDSIPTTRIRRL